MIDAKIFDEGTLVVKLSREELEKVDRVVVGSDHWCKVFYQDEEPGHGKWIENRGENGCLYGQCSNCKKETLYAISYDILGNRHIMNFCPNCGARMGGE